MKYHVTYGLLLSDWLDLTLAPFFVYSLLLVFIFLFRNRPNDFIARHKTTLANLFLLFFLYHIVSLFMLQHHAEVYVHAGDDGAKISYDGHLIHLNHGQDVILSKEVYLSHQMDDPLEFKCVSSNGTSTSASLEPGAYILDASGKGGLNWHEVRYGAKYKPRTDYSPKGSAGDGMRRISGYGGDVIYGVNEKPRESISTAWEEKIRNRYFAITREAPE